MRCEVCQGSRFIQGTGRLAGIPLACPACLNGEVNCCDGEVCFDPLSDKENSVTDAKS